MQPVGAIDAPGGAVDAQGEILAFLETIGGRPGGVGVEGPVAPGGLAAKLEAEGLHRAVAGFHLVLGGRIGELAEGFAERHCGPAPDAHLVLRHVVEVIIVEGIEENGG